VGFADDGFERLVDVGIEALDTEARTVCGRLALGLASAPVPQFLDGPQDPPPCCVAIPVAAIEHQIRPFARLPRGPRAMVA
jgi:hypothetical protein